MSEKYYLERQFSWVVGAVTAGIGLWSMVWGSRGRAGLLFFAIGVLLLCLGLVAPRLLVHPRRAWMGLAEVLSMISTRIILGVVFFAIVTPIAFVLKRGGWDPLARRREKRPTFWSSYSQRLNDPRHFEKMF